MCGIAGYLSNTPEKYQLKKAVEFLRLRGPDQNGVWEKGDVGLGHTRLSIIDVSESGRQPMFDSNDRYTIVFNGEIYNFPELRAKLLNQGERFKGHSDTEILLRLFIKEGFSACLSQLRGMFAFAVWDNNEQTLYIARDRLGVKPLVYSENAAGFSFASEIGALFAMQSDLSRKVDYQALDHYFTFQYIPAPMSGFASVRKLPPAHAMIVKSGKIAKIWRYWQIDPQNKSTLLFDEACEALRAEFIEATRLRLVSDVPLGAFLSGGIDSSITVAAMAQLNNKPVKTFAIGFSEERFNELPYAKQIAEHLHTDHHEMIVKADAISVLPQLVQHCGEPLADNSTVPTYFVSQMARKHVTVALTGDGGDEVFAGYKRFYQIDLINTLEKTHTLPLWRMGRKLTVALEDWARKRPNKRQFPASKADEALYIEKGLARYKHLLAFFTDQAKQNLYTPELQKHIGVSGTTDYLQRHFNASAGAESINRHLLLDMTTYLPEDILFKVDICSMLNSLECRSPFLDYKLIELVASFPGDYKLKFPNQHKYLLKQAFKDWLPEGFMNRGKKGFSAPMADWLRGDLAGIMKERLIEEKKLAHWIKQPVIENYISEHLSGKKSHSEKLWLLLVLAEWLEQYKVEL
jgi:asparagine synthase (glutamine-hydrolysing)